MGQWPSVICATLARQSRTFARRGSATNPGSRLELARTRDTKTTSASAPCAPSTVETGILPMSAESGRPRTSAEEAKAVSALPRKVTCPA